jgi:LuxR family maltose regulon positive regulatory protein
VTPEQFAFSPSKLAPPRLRAPLLPRPRLVDALSRGLERRLVLLTAEAGYGKTSVLSSALAGIPCPAAWLTLDERDTDPNLFGAGIVLALRRVAPSVGARALAVLAGGPSTPLLQATILQCLEELPRETLLVLDDFHALDGTPAAQELTHFLLEHLPSNVHVAIATRTRPPLRGLPRWIVQGEASVFDRSSLAFTAEEAVELLRVGHGVDPTDRACAALSSARKDGRRR